MKSTTRTFWLALVALLLVQLSTAGCTALTNALATPTPTVTNTPLPTDTPMPTDTPAPTETPVPTDTPVPTEITTTTTTTTGDNVDLSSVVLTAGDLPSFVEIPASSMGLENMALGNGEFKVKSVFTLVDQTTSQVLFGLTTYIPGALEQTGFDAYIKTPELLGAAATQGLANGTVVEKKALEVEQIGDSTGAITMLTEVNGVKMRMDMLVFRQGPVGVFLVNVYMDGITPTTSVADAGKLLSERIKAIFP